MKREFTRPDISPSVLKELLGKREILINPDWEEIESSLKRVQRACRKNRLTADVAKNIWTISRQVGGKSPSIGAVECPYAYGYEMETTLFQVVAIAPELTGVIIGREPTQPGTRTAIPVTAGSPSPSKWAEQVLTAFWTHLSDQEIEEVNQRAIVWTMTSIQKLTRSRGRRARRRQLQLLGLFRGVKPEFVSEFSNEICKTVELLNQHGLTRIRWKEFQFLLPSFSGRYKKDLLGFIRDGYITTEGLKSYVDDHERYALNLGSWNGQQRIFADPQLVLRITASRLYDSICWKGPRHMKLISTLRSLATSFFHPATADTVGWIRVHVDDENWISFIDEVQSDVMEHLYSIVRKDDSNADVASELLKEIRDWHFHAFSTVQHWSRSIGYTVAIHSRRSASKAARGKTRSERKWQTYYQSLIKVNRLVETVVPGYPGPIFLDTNTSDILKPS